MNLMISALSLVLSLNAFAGEGGVGVKNGGTAIQCSGIGAQAEMIEVSEMRFDHGHVKYITDRDEFFANIFSRLKALDLLAKFTLTSELKYALYAHGPISNWGVTPYRIPTILLEDSVYSRMVDAVDYISGKVHLKAGCYILPISYLTPSDVPHQYLPPRIVPENIGLLDSFNRNVLELHEALYEIFIARDPRYSVIQTRKLIRKLLNEDTTIEELKAETSSFLNLRPLPKFTAPSVNLQNNWKPSLLHNQKP